MRLIDADALMKNMLDSMNEAVKIGIPINTDYIWGLLDYTLENAPIIKPEGKKSKWIYHEPFDCEHHNCNPCIECNYCGAWFGADCYAKTNYCPNCGADMRGK